MALSKEKHNLYNDIKLYLSYLQFEKKLSTNTLNSYWHDLKIFADYISDTYKIDKLKNVKTEYIREYIRTLSHFIEKGDSRNKKISTISRTVSSIRSFYKYLFLNDIISENPIEKIQAPKLSKRIPEVLDVEEIDQILSSIDTTSKNGKRDKSLILLLYSCGLRVSELTKLKLINIFFDDEIIKIFGKGNKERIVPIGKRALNELSKYIENVRPYYSLKGNTKGFVFLSNRCKPLSRKTVWNIIKLASTKASIDKHISPHTFRHSFATHLLEGGAGLRVVQELLGHSSLSTTQIYTKIDKNYLKEIHKQYHPRG